MKGRFAEFNSIIEFHNIYVRLGLLQFTLVISDFILALLVVIVSKQVEQDPV